MKKLLFVILLINLISCSNKDFSIGECVIPKEETNPTKVIKVVSISDNEYITFSHFLSGDKLVLGEDYEKFDKDKINKMYNKIECPGIDATFSPDKYLNKDKNK
jgi:hypothetical protein